MFIVFVIGNCSITTSIISTAKKFGFYIALMTTGFRLYSIIGADKDSNTLLKQKQYLYSGIDIAKHIEKNKIQNQIDVLKQIRHKNEFQKEAISKIQSYYLNVDKCNNINEIMAYEGLSAKLYFKSHFDNVMWQGRQPRIKKDYINSVLDIGYTILFSFIDALLSAYGFDTYCGVMHKQFYMRKSLVCDIVEPFRTIIDIQVKKSINLKQIKAEDFTVINNQYKLQWENSSVYARLLLTPIIERKDDIFSYIQGYYRAFMKDLPSDDFPDFKIFGGK